MQIKANLREKVDSLIEQLKQADSKEPSTFEKKPPAAPTHTEETPLPTPLEINKNQETFQENQKESILFLPEEEN